MGGRGAAGSRSKNSLEGAKKANPSPGAESEAHEAREMGASSAREKITRTVSTCLINPGSSP